MIHFRKAVILLALLASTTASAVSRIGGGKISNDELGFVAQMPELFPTGLVDSEGNIRLQGLIPSDSSKTGRAFIFIFAAATYIPDLKAIDEPGQMDDWFRARGWRQRPNLSGCAHMYVSRNESGLTVALMWGAGKGVLISGEYTSTIYNGMNKLLSTFTVQPESCAWKP